jgi:hypothetical protein
MINLPIKIDLIGDKYQLQSAIVGEKGLDLTDHAQKRLRERFPELDLAEVANTLLTSSFVNRPKSVMRIISHKFTEAKYLVNAEKNICFVLPILGGEINKVATVYQISETNWIPKKYKKIAKENLKESLDHETKKTDRLKFQPQNYSESMIAESLKDIEPGNKEEMGFVETFLKNREDFDFLVKDTPVVIKFNCGVQIIKELGYSWFFNLPSYILSSRMFFNLEDSRLGTSKVSFAFEIKEGKIYLLQFAAKQTPFLSSSLSFNKDRKEIKHINFVEYEDTDIGFLRRENMEFSNKELEYVFELLKISIKRETPIGTSLSNSNYSAYFQRHEILKRRKELSLKLGHRFNIAELEKIVSLALKKQKVS